MKYFIFIFAVNIIAISPSFAGSPCEKSFYKPESIKAQGPAYQVEKSVWKIEVANLFTGTGFFISPNQFVTNFHVAEGILRGSKGTLQHLSSYFRLTKKNTRRKLKVKRIQKLSALHDLAILEIEGEVKDYLELAEKKPTTYDPLFVVGYPNGSLSTLVKTEDILNDDSYSFSFPVNYDHPAGASGSPVLNKDGKVTGVVFRNVENMVEVIKVALLKKLLEEESEFTFKSFHSAIEKEITRLEEFALKSNDPHAQYQLSVKFKSQSKYKKQERWLRKSAKQGYPPAQYDLFILYLKNNNIEESEHWLKEAINQGYAPAQYTAGMEAYIKGEEEIAKDLLLKSALQGYAPAQYELGVSLVEANLPDALYWLRLSANNGYVSAFSVLGNLYQEFENKELFEK